MINVDQLLPIHKIRFWEKGPLNYKNLYVTYMTLDKLATWKKLQMWPSEETV